MKVARTLILLLVGIFLALLGAFSAYEAERAVREADDDIAQELAITGRTLRPALSEVRQFEGEARAAALLAHADRDTPNVSLRWIGDGGPEAKQLGPETVAALARSQEVVIGRGERPDNRLVVYVPVVGQGAIELARPLAPVKVLVVRAFQDRILSALLAVAVASILCVLASVRLVGRPLGALAEQARRIGAGDLAGRLSIARTDEIGQLADEMNRMCEALIEAHARVAAAAEARVRAMDQLRRADRLSTVGTLASGMAHELGTPLSIISGRAKMIASDRPDSPDANYARIIVGQTEKMTRIMRGLLDFARRKPAQKRATDVLEIARRTLELLGPLAKKRDVTLRVEDGSGPMLADIDVAQVEQALANLVVNAVHAMPRSGEVVVGARVHEAVHPTRDGATARAYVCLWVKDAGDGIRDEDLPHVFEPFFTTKDVGEGTGLGLSVTYGIVEDHGGFVDVASELGSGSTFSLHFPREEEAKA